MHPPRGDKEAGHILLLAAAGLMALLTMAAFTVDFGQWYNISNRAQRAADAASLAAVAELNRVEGTGASRASAEAAAVATAESVARQNGFDVADGRISVSTAFSTSGANDVVRVLVGEDDVPLFFASLVTDEMSVARDASAIMGDCQATCDGDVVIPPPLGAMVDTDAGGDGYIAVRAGHYLFNVFHHTNGNVLQCTDLQTNAECNPPGVNYPVAPYPTMSTNYTPKIVPFEDRVYFVVQQPTAVGLGCWDSSTHARCAGFTSGPVPFAPYKKNGSNNGGARVDGPELVGNRLFAYGDDNRMYCFDPAAAALCPGYPRATGLAGVHDMELDSNQEGFAGGVETAGVQFDMLVHPANQKIYTVIGNTPDNKAWVGCFDTTTAAACTDWPTAGVAVNAGRRLLFFKYPTNGTLLTPDGVCARTGKLGGGEGSGHQCFDLTGGATTLTLPFAFSSGWGEQEATAPTTGGHLFTYFPDRSGDRARCWDWTAAGLCAISPSNWSGTAEYGYWWDGGGCMIGLGHDGRVWSFRVDDGQLPCEGNSAGQGVLEACTCGDGVTQVWTALTLSPTTDLSNFSTFVVTVTRPDGTVFTQVDLVGAESTVIDLSALNQELPPPAYLIINAHAITIDGEGDGAWFTTDGPAVTMLGGSQATLIE